MSEVKVLGRDDILAVNDQKIVDVEVPEWGGVVRLRSLDASELLEFTDSSAKGRADSSVKALLLCAVNGNGERIFTEKDVAVLKKKSLRAFMRIQKVVLELNGLTEEAESTRKND